MTDFLVEAARTEADAQNGRSLHAVANRQVIVVAGMHRSGTSAFARLLALLGAALPADMGDGADDNEAGFWEPLPIKELDDELLAVAGSRWDDVVAVPTDWYESDAAAAHVARAVELLDKEYGDAPLFVLKDPRICRLLPFWRRVFAAAAVDARYVIPLRNPLEVAASLERRNGFPTEKSLLLWLDHVLGAERWTRGLPRAFPRYEDLLEDPSGVTARIGTDLSLVWPRLTARTRREIDRFLVRDLRHHAYGDHELTARGDVAGWVIRAYGALLDIASGTVDQEARQEVLDQVSIELRDADAAYGPLVAALELDLDEVREDLRGAEHRLEEREIELRALAELREQLEDAGVESERLKAQVAELREQLEAGAGERKRLEGELEARVESHSEDLRELGRARSELEARAKENEALEADGKRRDDELEARAAAHAADLAELGRVSTELEARAAAHAADLAELGRVSTELEARATAHAADLEELARVSTELETSAAAVADVSAERDRIRSERDEQAAAATAELERLRGLLQGKESELEAASEQTARVRGQLDEALAARAIYTDELKRALDRLEEQHKAAAAEQAEALQERGRLEADLSGAREQLETAGEELRAERRFTAERLAVADDERRQLRTELDEAVAAADASNQELATVYSDLTRERESGRSQLAAAARERERLHGELEARVGEHSATLLELGRVRSELVGVQTALMRNSLHGRLRRLRRWPLAKLYRIWAAVLPAGVRLRARYASQLGSWLLRPTPKHLGWVRAYFSLRRSGAFDYHYYAHRYPEVVRARMNPLMHYIEHGAGEGRDPSARFSTSAYLARRPDLDPLRTNPLFEAQRRGDSDLAAPAALALGTPPASTGAAGAAAAEPERPQGDAESPVRPAPPADWRAASPSGVDVICLPIIDWHYRFQRPQQLASQFAAAGHRVFYAETKFHGDGDAVQVVDSVADGVWALRLPGSREKVIYTSTLDEAELESLLAALDAFRQVASISDAVIVVDLPFWAPLALEAARRFGWRVIYDCMDHHAGFLDDGFGSAAVRIAIEENEEALLQQSDAVLATSRLLYERIRPLARKTVLLPNGTDFAHFNGRPAQLALDGELERPVVGYYGAISSWFDVELVEAAARARPHWSFVLVGSTFGADVTPLEALPNVHLPGERPYAEIPTYLHAFDVACIPFKLNALTEATNPVKFYEYLSAGKPIVSTPLPELEPYEGYYYPARSAADFVSQVETALHENAPQTASRRVALALNNTWSARWKQLEGIVRTWFGRVAIVVLSYDNPEYLRLCLESIWAKTRHSSYDVYVVQNGSDPGIDAYLAREAEARERLHVVRPGSNLGFARANNLAVELAGECEYVVLLNDDVVVTDGWLGTLLRHLEDDTVGIVGPVTNWTGNEARVDVDYDGIDSMDAFATRHTAAHAGKTFDIASLAMYCVAIRRRLFDSLGRLDERFEVGMFEDDDFARRVRDAGLRVVCAEDVFVHHWGRASFSRMEQDQYDAVFEANRRRFEEKWGQAWEPHRSRT